MFNILKREVEVRRWLYLCLLVWVIKGGLLALIATAWMGEDELAHFGYANTLRRTGQWQVYQENWTTAEAWSAYQLTANSDNSDEVMELIQGEDIRKLRNELSDHWVGTGYQPPLYYWILGRVLSLPIIANLDVVSWVYVLRFTSVFMGGLTMVVLWKFLDLVQINNGGRMLAMGFIVWHPLFTFLHSMINVDVLVILEFSLWFYLLARGILGTWNMATLMGVCVVLAAGLYTKQSMLIPLVITGGVLLVEKYCRRITWFQLVATGCILSGICLSVYQEYTWRSSQTVFFAGEGETLMGTDSPYVLTQTERLKNNLGRGFWEMTLAFVPYTAPELFHRFARLLTALAVGGLVGFMFSKGFGDGQMDRRKRVLMWWALAACVVWGCFLLAWDYLVFTNSLELWFKGRYLFAMWVPIVWLLSLGWLQVAKWLRNERLFTSAVVVFFSLYQFTAWVSLLITMNT